MIQNTEQVSSDPVDRGTELAAVLHSFYEQHGLGLCLKDRDSAALILSGYRIFLANIPSYFERGINPNSRGISMVKIVRMCIQSSWLYDQESIGR